MILRRKRCSESQISSESKSTISIVRLREIDLERAFSRTDGPPPKLHKHTFRRIAFAHSHKSNKSRYLAGRQPNYQNIVPGSVREKIQGDRS